jgi:DNA polymerase-3 subunit delta
MKIAPREAERFLTKTPANICAILLYGPNAGLVGEFGDRLTQTIVPSLKDQDRIADLSADVIRKDPARLADEAAQFSMFSPGRRVIRIRDASEGMGELFADFLKTVSGDARIVVEAGELNARASLRQVFEAAKNAAAIACYEDTPETLIELAGEILKSNGAAADRQALELIVARLGLDRRLLRSELEKALIFLGPDKKCLTLNDASLLVGHAGTVEADEVAAAIGLGEIERLGALLEKAEEAGVNAGTLVGGSLRQLHALLAAKALGEGSDVNAARSRGLWGQSDQSIGTQLRLWSPNRLRAALKILGGAEIETRTTGFPDWACAARALLHAGSLARRN